MTVLAFGSTLKHRAHIGWLRPAWPDFSSLDLKAAPLLAFAMLAMFCWRFGMLPTLAVCGAAGLVLK